MFVFFRSLFVSIRSVFLLRFFLYFLALLGLFSLLSLFLALQNICHAPLVDYLKTTIAADAVLFDRHLTLGISAKEKAKSVQYTQAIVATAQAHTLYTQYPVTILGVNALSYPIRSDILLDSGHHFFQMRHGPDQGKVWISPRLGAALNITTGQSLIIGKRSFLVQFWLDDMPGRLLFSDFTHPFVMMNIDDFVRLSLPHAINKQDILFILGKEQGIRNFIDHVQYSPQSRFILASRLQTTRISSFLNHLSVYVDVFFLFVDLAIFVMILFFSERYVQDACHVAKIMSALGIMQNKSRAWLYHFYWVFFLILITCCFVIDVTQSSAAILHGVASSMGMPIDPFSQCLNGRFLHLIVCWLFIIGVSVYARTYYDRRAWHYPPIVKDGLSCVFFLCFFYSVFSISNVPFGPYALVFSGIVVLFFLVYSVLVFCVNEWVKTKTIVIQNFFAFMMRGSHFFSRGWFLLVLLTSTLSLVLYVFSCLNTASFFEQQSVSERKPLDLLPSVFPRQYSFSNKGIFLQQKMTSDGHEKMVWRGHIGVIFSDHVPLGFGEGPVSIQGHQVVVTTAFAAKNAVHVGDTVYYAWHSARYPLQVSFVMKAQDLSIAYPFSWILSPQMAAQLTSHGEMLDAWHNPYRSLAVRLGHFLPYQRQLSVWSHKSPLYLLPFYTACLRFLGILSVACMGGFLIVFMILSYYRVYDRFMPVSCTLLDCLPMVLAHMFLCLPAFFVSLWVLYAVLGVTSIGVYGVWMIGVALCFLVISLLWVLSFVWVAHRRSRHHVSSS